MYDTVEEEKEARRQKRIFKLRTRHMPTKSIKPKVGKGTYNRSKEKIVNCEDE